MEVDGSLNATSKRNHCRWFRIAYWSLGLCGLLVAVAFWLPVLAVLAVRHDVVSLQTVEKNSVLSRYWYAFASHIEWERSYFRIAHSTGLFDDVCQTIFWRCLMSQPIYFEKNPPCGFSMGFGEASGVGTSQSTDRHDQTVD